MGQLYSISAYLRFKDPAIIAKRLDEFIDRTPALIFRRGDFDDGDVRARLEAITCGDEPLELTYDELASGGCVFATTFHAIYSWERVLQGMFDAISPALRPGSSLTVYPDNGVWTRAKLVDPETAGAMHPEQHHMGKERR